MLSRRVVQLYRHGLAWKLSTERDEVSHGLSPEEPHTVDFIGFPITFSPAELISSVEVGVAEFIMCCDQVLGGFVLFCLCACV